MNLKPEFFHLVSNNNKKSQNPKQNVIILCVCVCVSCKETSEQKVK